MRALNIGQTQHQHQDMPSANSRTVRVAIVDDEEYARAALRVLLGEREDVDIVAECRNGQEAVEVLQWVTVDILLLDVQMPGLDGFGVLQAFRNGEVPVTVFVTAFDAYALRAFEVEAVDYVLKPFDGERFFAAFDRACKRLGESRDAQWARRLLSTRGENVEPTATLQLPRIPVPQRNRVIFVDFDEIDWIEAADQYVILHVADKKHLLRESLQRLVKRLPADRFARIHRSHVINATKVREIKRLGKGDAEVTLTTGTQLRLSRRYRRQCRAAFDWGL